MRSMRHLLLALSFFALIGACGGAQKHRRKTLPKGSPPPAWVTHIEVGSDQLCGVGVAGAAFDKNSPYPKELSEKRAVRNLAGALETNIQEAIVDQSLGNRTMVNAARVLTVDEALIEKVTELAETEFWLDEGGTGPFTQPNFTYAHTCIDAQIAAETLKVDVRNLRGKKKNKRITPDVVPNWIESDGKQPGGRLCAVGFSLPTFHPDKTFDVVVEDVRTQLAKVLQTLVSSYYEELTTKRRQYFEMMTVATVQAVSNGVIVTDFWYDRDGRGPFHRKRSTYGWGCVYPVDVMQKTVQSVEKELPEQVVAKVRERAQAAFDELDAEIEKRTAPPPQPDELPGDAPSPTAGHIDEPPTNEVVGPPVKEAPDTSDASTEPPPEIDPELLNNIQFR